MGMKYLPILYLFDCKFDIILFIMNFSQQVAKYISGNLRTDQLPAIAYAALEEGWDSPSLIILAGLEKNETAFQIEHYFNRALEELNIPVPDKRQAALQYMHALVEEILDGQREIIQGTKEIVRNILHRYESISEDKVFVFDGIFFEKAYGLLDKYDEIAAADIPWQKEKTNEELMIDVKAELLKELRIWKETVESN